MYKYEEQFRKDNPQTVGESDKHYDLDNYKDWLEQKLTESIEALKSFADFGNIGEDAVDMKRIAKNTINNLTQ